MPASSDAPQAVPAVTARGLQTGPGQYPLPGNERVHSGLVVFESLHSILQCANLGKKIQP
jgi:hypothetical protein